MDPNANPNEKTRAPVTEPGSRDFAEQADTPGRKDKPSNPDRQDDLPARQEAERDDRGNDRIEPGEEHTADRPAIRPAETPNDSE